MMEKASGVLTSLLFLNGLKNFDFIVPLVTMVVICRK
jgi:hypothetical protein